MLELIRNLSILIFWYHQGPILNGKPVNMGEHFPIKENCDVFFRPGNVGGKSGNFTQNT